MTQPLLTLHSVAAELNVPLSWVEAAAADKRAPVYDLHRRVDRWRVDPADLPRWREIVGQMEDGVLAEASPRDGYVYFLQANIGGPIKIGLAADVPGRIRELQCGCPWPLVLLAVAAGGRDLERQYHDRFASLRQQGEWFRSDSADLWQLIEAIRDVYGVPQDNAVPRLVRSEVA